MRILLTLATLLVSFGAAADVCDQLTQGGLQFGIPATTYTVNAGEKVKLPVQASLANPASWDFMDQVELEISAELDNHPGAAPLKNTVILKNAGKLVALPNELELQTTPAMSGDYSVSSYLTGGGCGIPSSKLPGVIVHVVNTPAKTELAAPVTSAVHLKPSYDINKPMTFTADIADQSALCLSSDHSGFCSPTFDIYFGAEEGLVFTRATATATPKPGRYTISFQGAFWEKGTYPLLGIWIEDQWGNRLTEDLPKALQKNLVVTGVSK